MVQPLHLELIDKIFEIFMNILDNVRTFFCAVYTVQYSMRHKKAPTGKET
jgi:hypothetical protein